MMIMIMLRTNISQKEHDFLSRSPSRRTRGGSARPDVMIVGIVASAVMTGAILAITMGMRMLMAVGIMYIHIYIYIYI